jgi:hypothetical protein
MVFSNCLPLLTACHTCVLIKHAPCMHHTFHACSCTHTVRRHTRRPTTSTCSLSRARRRRMCGRSQLPTGGHCECDICAMHDASTTPGAQHAWFCCTCIRVCSQCALSNHTHQCCMTSVVVSATVYRRKLLSLSISRFHVFFLANTSVFARLAWLRACS